MEKLRLDIDALQVESFDATPRRRAAGTVVGHEDAEITFTTIFTITPYITNGCTEAQNETCYYDCTTMEEDMTCMPSCVEYDGNICRTEAEAAAYE
jgi:hypothetical protein